MNCYPHDLWAQCQGPCKLLDGADPVRVRKELRCRCVVVGAFAVGLLTLWSFTCTTPDTRRIHSCLPHPVVQDTFACGSPATNRCTAGCFRCYMRCYLLYVVARWAWNLEVFCNMFTSFVLHIRLHIGRLTWTDFAKGN